MNSNTPEQILEDIRVRTVAILASIAALDEILLETATMTEQAHGALEGRDREKALAIVEGMDTHIASIHALYHSIKNMLKLPPYVADEDE
jgi:hypothetical protein